MAINTLSIDPYIIRGLLESKLKNETTASSGKEFGRILAETLGTVGNGNVVGIAKENAVGVAEMIKLEMIRGSLSLGDVHTEPEQSGIESKIKLMLKYFDEYRQKDAVTNDVTQCGNVGQLQEQKQEVRGLDSIIDKASRTYGVDPALIKAVIKAESNFNPQAVSSAGAQGLMQLMPATARGLGVTNSFDPEQNVMGGTKFLKQMLDRYSGDLNSALAAYNWGPGNLERKGGNLPRETREYLTRVKGYYAEYTV